MALFRNLGIGTKLLSVVAFLIVVIGLVAAAGLSADRKSVV